MVPDHIRREAALNGAIWAVAGAVIGGAAGFGIAYALSLLIGDDPRWGGPWRPDGFIPFSFIGAALAGGFMYRWGQVVPEVSFWAGYFRQREVGPPYAGPIIEADRPPASNS